MRQIVLVAHNLRSTHNVGSLLRTAEGLGVRKLIFSGYTPYPIAKNDGRLPHLSQKINKQIHKTALGAEESLPWAYEPDISVAINKLKAAGYVLAAVEQASNSVALPNFRPPNKIALILGREVEGLEEAVLEQCDVALEIPMSGQKESFNVAQAAAIAMYHCRYMNL